MSDPKNRCYWLTTLAKGSVGAEIGVHKGKFATAMLAIVEPSLLWLVDCWEAQDVKWNQYDWHHVDHLRRMVDSLGGACAEGRVRVLCAYSKEASDLVPDDSLDWVYIDAGHLYQEAYDDLSCWFPKVKLGGIVAGHDYITTNPWIGVVKAVEDFMEQHGQAEVKVTEENLPSFWWTKT